FCVFQMRLLTWLDWFNVLALVPINDPRAQQAAPNIPHEQLLAAMHCVAPDGRISSGARCFRHIGMRLPLLVPLALLMWVPGVIWIADKIYNVIARNRKFLSRIFGCKQACSIMPARKREQDKV